MIKFIHSIYLVAIPILTNAQVFHLKGNLFTSKTELQNDYLLAFEDTTGTLTLNDILLNDQQRYFQPLSHGDVYSNSSSNIWMKASIANKSSEERELILFFNDWDVSIWSLSASDTAFLGRKGILTPHTRSDFYLGENIGSKVIAKILPDTTITFYAKSPGFLEEKAFSIALQDLDSLDSQSQRDLWAIGIFTGCFFFICLATFFLFIKSLKWRSIFYATYALGGYLFFSGYYGIDFFLSFRWPFSYTLFLPISSLFYLLFVYHFLELNKIRIQGKIFLVYVTMLTLAIAILIYALIASPELYYNFLRIVNRVNIWFTIFSLFLIIKVPERQKFFVIVGVSFLFLGGLMYVVMKVVFSEHHSFIYPMIGFMLEMTTFLIGNFYVLNMEHRKSIRKLHEREKELQERKAELKRFTSMIKEKNRLIEDFKAQLKIEEEKEKVYETSSSLNGTIDHLMQSTILTPDEWTEFKRLFSQVYPGFLGSLRSKYPDLTETDERLMALTKLNLNNGEISSMLGVSTDTVYKTRYRLSKKLNIASEEIEAIVEAI